MKKIRLSYSLLKLYEQNRFDDLVNYYFKMGEVYDSYQMEEGRAWDKLAMESIEHTGKLPPEFNNIEMLDPKCQHKIVVPWGEDYELVAKLDVLDANRIFELKTGMSMDSADYCNEKQVGVYILACEMMGTPVEKAYIIHFDQSLKKTDMSLVWKTNELLEETTLWIDSLAPKIRTLLEEKGLI